MTLFTVFPKIIFLLFNHFAVAVSCEIHENELGTFCVMKNILKKPQEARTSSFNIEVRPIFLSRILNLDAAWIVPKTTEKHSKEK